MNVVKCLSGHYFDKDTFDECPVCGAWMDSADDGFDDDKTEYIFAQKHEVSQERESVSRDENVTMSPFASRSSVKDPIRPTNYESPAEPRAYANVAPPPPPIQQAPVRKNSSSKKVLAIVAAVLGLLLLLGLLGSLFMGMNKSKPTKGTDVYYADGEKMELTPVGKECIILGGNLSSNKTTVSFTLPLPKNAENMNVEINKLRVNVRHSEGGYLYTEKYTSGGYNVLGDNNLKVDLIVSGGYYLTITIEDERGCDIPNNTPVSVTINDIELVFSEK